MLGRWSISFLNDPFSGDIRSFSGGYIHGEPGYYPSISRWVSGRWFPKDRRSSANRRCDESRNLRSKKRSKQGAKPGEFFGFPHVSGQMGHNISPLPIDFRLKFSESHFPYIWEIGKKTQPLSLPETTSFSHLKMGVSKLGISKLPGGPLFSGAIC